MDRRSNYKETWNNLASTMDEAKIYVAGYTDETLLDEQGQHTVDLLDQFIGIKPTDTVLEIGCGVGRVGKILSQRCRKWIGTDISKHMLNYAAERLKDYDNVELIELSTVGLYEIPDSSIDVVYCTVVFMHLYEWDRYAYIKEAFRVLKPGGRCFFDNIDITTEYGWQFFLQSASVDPNTRPAHISSISTADELYTYVTRAGFKNVRIHRWDDAWVGATGVKPEPGVEYKPNQASAATQTDYHTNPDEQSQHRIRYLEATIERKNKHIKELEGLLKRISNGRVMRVINKVKTFRR